MTSQSTKADRVDLDRAGSMVVRGYEIQTVIGKDSFRTVYLVKKGTQELAMKEVRLSGLAEKDVKHGLQEGETMRRLTHKNLVKLHEFFQQDKKLYIVMEHFAGGSLEDYLTKIRRDLDEGEVLDFMVDIGKALQFLHDKDLIHRDVKPSNIYMTKYRKLKLGDMTLARVNVGRFWECKPVYSVRDTPEYTPEYRVYKSPEVIKRQRYDQKSDIWSLGCCFYEMCHRRGLFSFATSSDTVREMLKMSVTKTMNSYTIHSRVCGEMDRLFKAMISYDARNRPSISDILHRLEPHTHASTTKCPATTPHTGTTHTSADTSASSLAPPSGGQQKTLAKLSISDLTVETGRPGEGRRRKGLYRIRSWLDSMRGSPRHFKTSDYETDTEQRNESTERLASFKIDQTSTQKLSDERTHPTQSDIQEAYDADDTSRFEQLTNIARTHILNQSRLIKRVRVTYSSPGNSNVKEIVFIAFTEKFDKINILLPYTTVFRKIEEYSSEGVSIMYSKESLGKPFTKVESTNITNALQKHSENMMGQHSNIQIISACSVKSNNFGRFSGKIIPTTCIVIYVDVKGLIPVKESLLPEALDGIPVDVREGGSRLFIRKTPGEHHTSLRMGCQISSEVCSGTLGAFVEEPDSKKLYCLTCAHVVVKPEDFSQNNGDTVTFSADKRKVYQPTPDVLNQIGSVEKAVFKRGGGGNTGVDVALISVEARPPLVGEFPAGDFLGAGFDAGRPMVYTSGAVYTQDTMPDQYENRSEIIKFGTVSGPTRGSFFLNGTSVHKHTMEGTIDMKFGYTLFNQFEVLSLDPTNVRPFATEGDSGSLVFFPHNGKCSDLRAFGILEGGTSYNTYLVTPIWDVLNSLNLPLRLKPFPLHPVQASSLASSLEGISLQSITPPGYQTAPQTNVEERIKALKQELLADADRRDQAKTQEMAAQKSETHTKIDGVARKLDTLMDKFSTLSSKLEKQ